MQGVDIALRLDGLLAAGRGDGWRFAALPPDAQAHATALDALTGFEAIDEASRDERLVAIADGSFTSAESPWSAAQWHAWFEDLRSDLVQLWLAHPATLARIGFDGFATGGDGSRLEGFDRLGAGDREAWEPAA